MKPVYEYIVLAREILWEKLEENPPKTKEQLNKIIVETRKEYAKRRDTLSCTGNANYMLRDAEIAIARWNFSYDEALQEVDIKYGYNPETGKWDGSYKPDCA